MGEGGSGIEMTVELHFFELRGSSIGKSKVVFADINDPMDKVVAKAAKLLGIRAEEVALMTPYGAPVQIYDEEGKPLSVREVVEKHGFSYAIVTKDVLGTL